MRAAKRALGAFVRALASMAAGAAVGSGFVVLALVACGCTNLTRAKLASNALGAGLDAAAPVLVEECIEPLESVTTATPAKSARDMVESVRDSLCPDAVDAYDVARGVHRSLAGTIGAIEAGRCAGVSPDATECAVERKTGAALYSTADLACTVARVADAPELGELCAIVDAMDEAHR